MNMTHTEPTLRQHVFDASRRPEVCEAVTRLYAALDDEVNRRRPLCVSSGRCCHFDEFGHRLYITTMELAAFMQGLRQIEAMKQQPSVVAEKRGLPILTTSHQQPLKNKLPDCPFQIKKLCGVHAIRPFGCRMFFCDASSTIWQQEQYERFHAELKQLHGSLDVPYFYIEWRQALHLADIVN